MANDLATLREYLAIAVRDTNAETWSTAELDDLVRWSVARLWPRQSYQHNPTTKTVTLVADTYHYTIPSDIDHIARCEWYTSGGDEYGALDGAAWELVGGVDNGTARLHVAPIVVDQGGILRLISYTKYDTTTHLIPDELVQLVLAYARAEAYRRLAGDRQRFTAWLSRNQTQNISINEMLQMINEAETEARRLKAERKTWQKPVPGRQG